MRRLPVIVYALVFFLAGCGNANRFDGRYVADGALCEIDSAMWIKADSAFAMINEFAASPKYDGLDDFNRHYCSLLVSELLYKNDCLQNDRAGLDGIMGYFDSVCRVFPSDDYLVFLDARAHYMKGVGLYETDSVVEACKEYLRALEIMESRFGEDEVSGDKARFMGLTHTRLGEVFYNQGIAKAAIESYKNALLYFNRVPNYSLANTYRRIGGSYHLYNNNDSALYYYRKARNLAKNQNNIFVYGASLSEAALLYYDYGYIDSAFSMIRESFQLSINEDQRLTRFFTLGVLFLNEHIYDSAILYFKQSLLRNNYYTHTASEEKLIDCYSALGDSVNENFYKLNHNESLQRFVESAPYKMDLVSLYENSKHNKSEKQHKLLINKRNNILIVAVFVVVFIIVLVARLFLMYNHKKNGIISALNNKIKAKTFEEEPVCADIINAVKIGHFKAQMDFLLYANFALGIEKLELLRGAVDEHFNNLTVYLRKNYVDLTNDDINYCCLYILGLKDADISALMQRSYRTVCDRNKKIRTIFGINEPINVFLRDIAHDELSH